MYHMNEKDSLNAIIGGGYTYYQDEDGIADLLEDIFHKGNTKQNRNDKDKAKMWSFLDKSLKIINKFPVLEKMEIRATIKRFIRFYSFLIQATCYENSDLHMKYNFLTYLVKEIEIGGGGNDFDIADKITASNFRQKKMGEETSPIELLLLIGITFCFSHKHLIHLQYSPPQDEKALTANNH